jgi:hypothetical protein
VAATASPITAACIAALSAMPPRRRGVLFLDSSSPVTIAASR